MDEFSWNSANR